MHSPKPALRRLINNGTRWVYRNRSAIYRTSRNIALSYAALLLLVNLSGISLVKLITNDPSVLLAILAMITISLVIYIHFEKKHQMAEAYIRKSLVVVIILIVLSGIKLPTLPFPYLAEQRPYLLITAATFGLLLYLLDNALLIKDIEDKKPSHQKGKGNWKSRLDTLIPTAYLTISIIIFFIRWKGPLFRRFGLAPVFSLFSWLDSTPLVLLLGYGLIALTFIYVLLVTKNLFASGFSFTPAAKFLGKNKWGLTLPIILFITAFYSRLPSRNFTSAFPDSFAMPLIAANMIQKGPLIFSNKLPLIPIGINWESPSGRYYTRGWPYTLSLLISYKVFGITDFASRFPGIIFGSLSVILTYLIATQILNQGSGLIASSLLAMSGWSIAMDTHIRHYSLLTTLFLGSIYFYLRYRKTQKNHYLFGLLTILAIFLQIDIQATLPALLLLSILLLDSFFGYRRVYELGLRMVNVVLIILVTISITDPFPKKTAVGYIQMASYHFGYHYWLFVWFLVLSGSLLTLRNSMANRLSLLFFSAWLALPYLAEVQKRFLNPRYTAIYFPLFIIFLALLVSVLIKRLVDCFWPPSLKESIRKTAISLFSIEAVFLIFVFSNNFFLPGQNYTKNEIWPKSYDPNSGTFSAHPLAAFASVYPMILKAIVPKTDGPIAVMSTEPNSLLWYTAINEETANKNLVPFFLANYPKMLNWPDKNTQSRHPFRSNYAVNYKKFGPHSGVPVVSDLTQLKEATDTYKSVYIVIDKGYDSRLTDFTDLYEYLETHLTLLKDSKLTGVYYWERPGPGKSINFGASLLRLFQANKKI